MPGTKRLVCFDQISLFRRTSHFVLHFNCSERIIFLLNLVPFTWILLRMKWAWFHSVSPTYPFTIEFHFCIYSLTSRAHKGRLAGCLALGRHGNGCGVLWEEGLLCTGKSIPVWVSHCATLIHSADGEGGQPLSMTYRQGSQGVAAWRERRWLGKGQAVLSPCSSNSLKKKEKSKLMIPLINVRDTTEQDGVEFIPAAAAARRH